MTNTGSVAPDPRLEPVDPTSSESGLSDTEPAVLPGGAQSLVVPEEPAPSATELVVQRARRALCDLGLSWVGDKIRATPARVDFTSFDAPEFEQLVRRLEDIATVLVNDPTGDPTGGLVHDTAAKDIPDPPAIPEGALRPTSDPGLAGRVDTALRHFLRAGEIAYDSDGDVPIRCGAAMVFVRVLLDEGLVSVFSPVLFEVTTSADLLGALNDMNTEIRFARAVLRDTEVTVVAEVDSSAEMETSLALACDAVAWASNQWGERLQTRFGGQTFFGEPVPAPTPAVGLYL